MRLFRALLVLLALLPPLAGAPVAAAERRVALVVGNGAYQHLATLPNPPNDARAMSAALRRLGFEVEEAIDLDRAALDRRLRAFVRGIANSDIAAFFYAGHGLQVDGRNYLVPVDAQLSSATELPFETLDLDPIVGALERGARISLVFLDACRDNPLAQRLAQAAGRGRSLAVGRGLAPIETGTGTMIAFATQPGNVAVDGEGANSPFTAALVQALEIPGLEVRQVMTRVRQTVIAATNGAQVPWDHSSLTEDVYLLAPRPAEPPEPPPPPPPAFDPRQADLAFWESVKDSREPRAIEEYLRRFPDGIFAGLATLRLEDLRRPAPATPAAPETRVAARTEEPPPPAPAPLAVPPPGPSPAVTPPPAAAPAPTAAIRPPPLPVPRPPRPAPAETAATPPSPAPQAPAPAPTTAAPAQAASPAPTTTALLVPPRPPPAPAPAALPDLDALFQRREPLRFRPSAAAGVYNRIEGWQRAGSRSEVVALRSPAAGEQLAAWTASLFAARAAGLSFAGPERLGVVVAVDVFNPASFFNTGVITSNLSDDNVIGWEKWNWLASARQVETGSFTRWRWGFHFRWARLELAGAEPRSCGAFAGLNATAFKWIGGYVCGAPGRQLTGDAIEAFIDQLGVRDIFNG
jgi:hypothetical protein